MGIIDFSPIDSEGIRLDRPASEVKWRKLTNVVVQDGSFVSRPGFKEFGDTGSIMIYGTSPNETPILGINQVENPGSSATGRESWTIAGETIRPDASSDIVAGWTGGHANVNGASPSEPMGMHTSTAGAQKSFTFPNPSTSWANIAGLTIRGFATTEYAANTVTLKFYQRVGSTNYEIGSVSVDGVAGSGTAADSEQEGRHPFTLALDESLDDNCSLEDADVDALNIVVEYESGTNAAVEWVTLAGDGASTEWVRNTDKSTTAAYTDFNNNPARWPFNTAQNEIATNALGAKQGFTLQSALVQTYSSISGIEFVGFAKAPPNGEHKIKFYYRTGGVEYDLVNDDGETNITARGFFANHPAGLFSSLFDSGLISTNPATGSAWTDAEIESGEFGVVRVSGTGYFTLINLAVYLTGLISGSRVGLLQLAVDVNGVTSSVPGSGFLASRLSVSSNACWRYDKDLEVVGAAMATSVGGGLTTSPPMAPVDHTIMYGQAYFVNGVDATIRYPNGSNFFEALSTNNADGSTPLTGRTVAHFGSRILYGWVKDNTTVTPERVSYSKIFDGGTHVDSAGSAGDFDLLDTPGGVVNLTPLNEDICFAGKEQGIYALRLSGRSSAPIFRDVIDFSVRCLSITGVQRVHNEAGQPIVIFLGWGPEDGYNVFAFDGSSVRAVGGPISKALREDANHQQLRFAFSGVEPTSGSYWLAFAEGDNINVNSGYAYHVRTGAWTRFEMPWDFFSMGVWTIPEGVCASTQRFLWGEPRLVLGGILPYIGKDSHTSDSLAAPSGNIASTYKELYSPLIAFVSGRKISPITAVLETGDIDLTNEMAEVQMISYRWRMEYEDLGPFRVQVDSSEDGGESWNTAEVYQLGGDTTTEGQISHYIMDVGARNAYRTRFRFTIGPEDALVGGQTFKINKLKLEYQIGGDGV